MTSSTSLLSTSSGALLVLEGALWLSLTTMSIFPMLALSDASIGKMDSKNSPRLSLLKMKSISDLNTKWWYRLVKVLFLFVVVIAVIASFFITYAINEPRTVDDYNVTCNIGTRGQFYAIRDSSIFISSYDMNGIRPSVSMPDYLKQEVQSACGITQADAVAYLGKAVDKMQAGGTLADSDLMWTAIPVTYQSNTQTKAILYSALVALITLGVFEIVRRAFYYIVLGKIRPSK